MQAPKIWERAKAIDPAFTCANLFWWYNMYSTADIAVTPRPMYPADGRKLPDVYTAPGNLRDELSRSSGPSCSSTAGLRASIESTRWLPVGEHRAKFSPTLSVVYAAP